VSLASDLKQRYPEFSTWDNATIDAQVSVWPCYFGGQYSACNREIILNLVAHLLTVDSGGAAAMPTATSRTVGSVSESYAQQSDSTNLAAFFGATKYGQRYLFLTQTRAAGRAFFV